jgi:hypothetical protein
VRHVVAVAEVGDADALEAAEPLPDGQEVGQRLAGMVVVGEGVDDRLVRERGHLVEQRLRKRAHDDRARVPGEDAGGVGDRLAAAELELVGPKPQRQRPEVLARRRERDACPRGRLLEEHRDRVAVERGLPAVRGGLHLGGEVEEHVELACIEVGDAKQVARRGDRGGRLVGADHGRLPSCE